MAGSRVGWVYFMWTFVPLLNRLLRIRCLVFVECYPRYVGTLCGQIHPGQVSLFGDIMSETVILLQAMLM